MDSDFEGKPYILKAKADESPIEIPAILNFIGANAISCQIRGVRPIAFVGEPNE